MPVRPILRHPDPRLSLPCAEVSVFDEGLHSLARDLLDTMRAAPGIGITAAHVGVMRRVVVIELSPGSGVVVAINPRVTWSSPELARHPEGSVSMPGVVEEVERPARVRVAFQQLDGNVAEAEHDGLMAVCMQHEIDQLDGVFWLQRLSRLRRERAERRFARIVRDKGAR